MKRILYFYPHKFSGLTDGIHTRIVTMLEYFKDRGFLVDMINFENPAVLNSYVTEHKLVDNLYLLTENPFLATNKKEQAGFKKRLSGKFNRLLNQGFPDFYHARNYKNNKLPNLMTNSLSAKVAALTEKNEYLAVLVTYTYWSAITKSVSKKYPVTKKIIDPTDFLTLQQFYGDQGMPYRRVGDMFGDEIERVSQFDDIMHISYDELFVFSNFIQHKKHHYIPQFFEQQSKAVTNRAPVLYDVLLIASGNPYNIEGINWFLQEVYPLLKKNNIKIAVAGNICNKFSFEGPGIIKLGFVDDVTALYSAARCTICPLKRGSGMKIKVVESLSYGIPVVSTSKGLDGFFNKDLAGGVLVTDQPQIFAAFIERLLTDDEYYKLQCELAGKIFQQYFSLEANYLKLDTIFQEQ
ncbi:MAG: glycosyltransferase family 4 protein [Chitinophagaceae bacterium]